MNVLLLSMPDSFEHMPTACIRMPNGALPSLAGNVDPHHRVAIADLILVQRQVRETVSRLVAEFEPDVVGMSVMTFQRRTALRIAHLIRTLRPSARIVVGGYDPSLAPEAYVEPSALVDFIVRGEGEATFSALLRAIEEGTAYDDIAGLSYRAEDGFKHNPSRAVHALNGDLRLPQRSARVLTGYTFMGRPVEVVETSRGCTYDCSFCSIIEMRGRNFHTFSIDRVIQDIQDAYDHGARAVFIVDDNISLNVARLESLCRAITEAGLHKIDYAVQAMTSALANQGSTLAPLMRKAGFRYVFLGIENILDDDLQFLRASSKNRQREHGKVVGNASVQAIEYLHRNGMYVVGGLIVGNPDDTAEDITANLEFARRYVDWPYIQHPTPYPGTPMTQEFREQGLIVNERLEEYDGTTAVVRSKHLSADDIEFMRWKADRWIKARHFPVASAHSPWFALTRGIDTIAHTFRGSSWRSVCGLEDDRRVFARYKAIRQTERDYLPDAAGQRSPLSERVAGISPGGSAS